MFPVVKVVVLAATGVVTKPVVKPLSVARWISKFASLLEVSVHVNVTHHCCPVGQP